MSQHYDVVILGAGTAGLSALNEIKKHTDNFLIVNAGAYGTTCARVGCMPSKLLIEAANAYHRRNSYDTFGIRGSEALSVDMAAVMQRLRALRDDFVAGTLKATDVLGKRSIQGHAKVLAPDCIEVNGEKIKTRALIIATGSHPFVPKPWQAFGNRLLTTDTLFEQDGFGPRLGVIGMGPVGAEMAQALARLGVKVSAFSKGDMMAGLSDPEINAVLRGALEAEMDLHTGQETTLEKADNGVAIVAGDKRTVVDQVLVAVGRKPNVHNLGLENLGVPLDDDGMPEFDVGSTQVGDLRVFIAGDVNRHQPLLHEAADEGHIAGKNALADKVHCYDRRKSLAIAFVAPEAAVIGQSAASLKGQASETGAVDFAKQGRARAGQRNLGKIALYVRPDDGKLLGAELCAPAAEHMAHLLALAITREMSVHDLLAMPFYHPVLEEGLRTALRNAAKKSGGKPESDLAHCPPLNIPALE